MSNADTNLLSGLVEKTEEGHTDGITVTTFKLSGEPYANAIVNSVVENYNRIIGHGPPTEEELRAKVGQKVTLVRAGENMLGASILNAIEGRLIEGTGGALAILPKGSRKKGYRVEPSKVLEVLDGWVTNVAQANAKAVRDSYPELRNLTKERLEELPGEGSETETLSLALFGEQRMPDSRAVDSIWLIGEYWPEDDICDRCVLLIRPEHGTSEHGSVYGRQLLNSNAIGEIVGFPGISFREAIELCYVDFDEASQRIFDMTKALA